MPRRRTKPPPTIERRGDSYRCRAWIGGRRESITVAVTDRRTARALIDRRIAELERQAERRLAGAVTGVRMSQVFDRFERDELPPLATGTQAAYRDSLKPLREYWCEIAHDPSIDSVRRVHIDEFLVWRRTHRLSGTKTLSAWTVRKDRAVLGRIFTEAAEWEFIEGNPVAATRKPKVDQRDPVILSDDQYNALLDACEGRPLLHLFALTLGESGARSESEVLRLTWESVRLDEGFIYISQRSGRRVKGGKARWVPMTARLATAMRDHFARYRFAQYKGKPTPWIFHHDHDEARFRAGDRVASLWDGFKRAAARAKLPPELRPHDMRHRRITKWLGEGQSATLVKEAVGHADLRTTMGYTHLSREHLRALVQPPVAAARKEAVSGA